MDLGVVDAQLIHAIQSDHTGRAHIVSRAQKKGSDCQNHGVY